jgi:hypothetical protein
MFIKYDQDLPYGFITVKREVERGRDGETVGSNKYAN